MKMISRTKQVKRNCIIFRLSSTLCFLGIALFAIIAAFSKVSGSEKTGVDILSEAVKTKIISLSITVIIGLIISLLIKEKLRTTVYMLSLIVITTIYHDTGMYITLGVWALDEYVLFALYKKYKTLITINKEIDKRS